METELEKRRRQECYLREYMCEEKECRFHIDWMETGNCVLRVHREHTLEEIGIAEGVTRERIRQGADIAMKKFWYRFPTKLRKQFIRHTPGEMIVRHRQ